jgi:hypothetical protein
MTAPRVMTELLERTGLTELLATSLPSATVDPSAKDATSMPRASLTVPFARPATSDATTALRGTPVPSVMIALRAMTVLRVTTVFRGILVPFVMTVAPCATIAQHGMTVALSETTADRGPTASLVTRDPFATTVRHGMTVLRVTIVSLETNVLPAATRTSIPRATKKRFTNPATTSCSIACRRWPPLRRMSTA